MSEMESFTEEIKGNSEEEASPEGKGVLLSDGDKGKESTGS
jgi:hypothetical protein